MMNENIVGEVEVGMNVLRGHGKVSKEELNVRKMDSAAPATFAAVGCCLFILGYSLPCQGTRANVAIDSSSLVTEAFAPSPSAIARAAALASPATTAGSMPEAVAGSLGEECCPDGILLSPEGEAGYSPDIAVDRLGRAHVVWKGGDNCLWYARVGSQQKIEVGAKPLFSNLTGSPKVAADSKGSPHIVAPIRAWIYPGSMLLYVKVAESAQGEVLIKTNVFSLFPAYSTDHGWPSIDVNRVTDLPVVATEARFSHNLNPYITLWWEGICVFGLDEAGRPGTLWSAYWQDQATYWSYVAGFPDVAVDALGRTHCVWSHRDPGWTGSSVGYALEGADYWTDIANERNVGGFGVGGPKIARGDEGCVEIVWTTTAGTVVWQRTNHDGLTLIDDGVISDSTAKAHRPNVCAGSGRVLFAWADDRGGQSQIYGRNPPDDEGDEADRLIACSPGSAFFVSLAARGAVSVDYVWQDNRNGLFQIYYLPLPPPVILVHGWHGSPAVWKDLSDKLSAWGLVHYIFDYSPANLEPRGYAGDSIRPCDKNLKKFIEDKKKETGYAGKFDIVCHSMGALVSRWYMEELDGAKNVRQWIGIAPATHGIALCDKLNEPPWCFLKLLRPVIGDLRPGRAIVEMQTTSETVRSLDVDGTAQCVKHRVIAGVNKNNKPGFWTFASRFRLTPPGKTYVKAVVAGKKCDGNTCLGDGLIALEQSRLEGEGLDCFEGYDHNGILEKEDALDTVIEYILDPFRPVACRYHSGGTPTEDCLRPDPKELDCYVPGAGNEGFIYRGAEVPPKNFLMDSTVKKAAVQLIWSGSELNLVLTSPSGSVMQEGTYPVVEYDKDSNAIWYVLDAPEPGIWTAQIEAVDVPEEGEEYVFMVYYLSDLRAELATAGDKFGYGLGEAATILATVADQDMPIIGATVSADVKRPDGLVDRLTLYDDGTYGDILAADGIYTNTYFLSMPGYYGITVFARMPVAGRHEITALASGTAYGSFERMAFLTILVETPLQVNSIRPNQDGTVSLAWEPEQVGVEAEYSTDLRSWTLFPGAEEEGGLWRSTLPPSGNLGFFRLKMR